MSQEQLKFIKTEDLISKLKETSSDALNAHHQPLALNEMQEAVKNKTQAVIPQFTHLSLRNVQTVGAIDYAEECYGEKPVKWYQRKSYNLSEQAKKAIDDQLSQKTFLFEKTRSCIDISHQALSVVPEAAVNKLPQNKYTNGFKSTLTFIKALVSILNPLLKLANQSGDSLKTLGDVKNRITQIKGIQTNLQEIEKSRAALKGTLEREIKKVTAVLDRIKKEGNFFNQEVIDEMYEHLLDHYLDLSSKNQENPLYQEIQCYQINEVKRKILDQTNCLDLSNHSKTTDILNDAINKGRQANLQVISVLLINLAHHRELFNLIEESENQEIKNLMEKSNNTMMIDVHETLFDFDHPFTNLFSKLPKSEDFDLGTSKDKGSYLLVEKLGSSNHKQVLKNIASTQGYLNGEGKYFELENKPRTSSSLKDSFLKWWHYYSWYQGLEAKQRAEVLKYIPELVKRSLYADRFNDPGIMHDYLRKIQDTSIDKDLKNPNILKNYINFMHGIDDQIHSFPTRAYRRCTGNVHPHWEQADGVYTFNKFAIDTGVIIEKLRKAEFENQQEKTREAQEKAKQEAEEKKAADEKAKQADEKAKQEAEQRKVAEEKTKQETQRAEQEAQARKQAEEKARQESERAAQYAHIIEQETHARKQAEEKAKQQAQRAEQAEERLAYLEKLLLQGMGIKELKES